MNKYKLLFCSYICIFSNIALGISFSKNNLESLFEISNEVVHVKIISSSIALAELNSERLDCGIDYVAEVSKSYKSELSTVTFRTYSQLNIGYDYLLFLESESLDINMAFEDVRSEEYKICTASGPNLFTGWWQGGIFEETETIEIIGDPSSEMTADDLRITEYFKHSSDHTDVDSEISVVNVDINVPEEFSAFVSFLNIDFQIFNKNEFMKHLGSIIDESDQ